MIKLFDSAEHSEEGNLIMRTESDCDWSCLKWIF